MTVTVAKQKADVSSRLLAEDTSPCVVCGEFHNAVTGKKALTTCPEDCSGNG
jgi:hypothetical protein